MASNVTIAYLADVTDLRTKSALAKAALTDVNASVREQASAFAELSEEGKSAALPALQALAAEQAKLRAVVTETAAALRRESEESEHQIGIFGRLHESVSLTTEKFEGLTARLQVFSGAFAAISEFALVGLGIERVTEAVNEFTEKAEAMDKLSAATGLATDQLYGLQHVARMTATPFEDVQGALAKLARAEEEAAQNADSKAGRALRAMGIDIEGAAYKALSFGDRLDLIAGKLATYESGTDKSNLEMALFGRSAESLTKFLDELGRDGLDSATDKAKQLGLTLSGPAIKAADEYQERAKALGDAWTRFSNILMNWVVPALNAVDRLIAPTLDEQIENLKVQIDHVANAPLAFLIPGAQDAQIAHLREELAALEAQKKKLEEDEAGHNQRTFGSPDAPPPGSVKAPAFTDKSGSQLDQFKDELLKMQIVDGQYHALSAAQEAAFWRTKLSLVKDGTTEQREVLQEFESASRRAETEGTRAAKKSVEEQYADFKGGIDQQIAAAKDNFALRISLLQQEVAEAKKLFGEKSKAAIEADLKVTEAQQQQKENAIKALEEQLATSENVQRALAAISATGGKADLGEFKPSISLVFNPSEVQTQIDAQIAVMRQTLDAKLSGLQQEINGRLDIAKTLQPGTAAFDDQMKTVTADFATMAEANQHFTDDAVSLNERAAQAVSQSWAAITGPIENAFGTILDSALSGNQNIAVSAERAAASMVSTWVKALITRGAQWAANEVGITSASATGEAARAALANSAEAQQISAIAAKLGIHTAAEAQQTGATAIGTAQRNALGQTENAGFISRVFTSIAQWLGLESSKTAATVAGEASRTGAQAAGAAAGHAAQTVANVTTVQANAAVAATGAFAATAAIPVVGPELAPAAATAAYAQVEGFGAAASAAGGWGDVPEDDYPTFLHRKEMVLPAGIAEGVRDMTSRGTPSLATAGNSSITNEGGVSVGAMHYSPQFHGSGNGGTPDLETMLRSDKRAFRRAMYSTAQGWYANGSRTLPGRTTWR